MTFKPQIGLEGFHVVSSFNVDLFECRKLEGHVFQLAVILYPSELVNEKFLISVRDCILGLPVNHPVKVWFKHQSEVKKPTQDEQQKIDFLNEMLNSPFNLITDLKVRTSVIGMIGEIPGETNLEQLLKSYLYLMIGNITHSDNILKTIISASPREFYSDFRVSNSIYHRIAANHLDKIFKKFSRHPADRLIFFLLTTYIKMYLNKTDLIELNSENIPSGYEKKLDLTYTERIAPEIVDVTRLSNLKMKERSNMLRMKKYNLEMQSYWVWPFLDIGPQVSDKMIDEILTLEKSDPIWVSYLIQNEKWADLYIKKGGLPLSRRRQELRKHLAGDRDFMLAFYKLLEAGDVDPSIVSEVARFMTHE